MRRPFSLAKLKAYSVIRNEFTRVMFSFIGNSTLRSLTLWERLQRDRVLNPYRITAIHWLMARRRLWRNDVVRSYWRTRHPLLRFLCLHEAVTLPFVVTISYPSTTLAIIHLHFGDCLSGTLFLLAVKCHGVSSLYTAVRAFHRSRRPTQ